LFDAKNWTEIAKLGEHTDIINTVAFSPDGTILASGSNDGSVIFWDILNLKQKDIFVSKPDEKVHSIYFLNNNFLLIGKGGTISTIVYDIINKMVSYYYNTWGKSKSVHASNDNKFIIVGNYEKILKLKINYVGIVEKEIEKVIRQNLIIKSFENSVQIDLTSAGNYSINLYSENLKLISSLNLSFLEKGINSIPINFSNLPLGVYFLEIKGVKSTDYIKILLEK
jgi:WD40 repeat protein